MLNTVDFLVPYLSIRAVAEVPAELVLFRLPVSAANGLAAIFRAGLFSNSVS